MQLKKFFKTILLTVTTATLATSSVAESTQSFLNRISVQLAKSCGMDSANKEILNAIQRSPAFYAISGHVGLSGREDHLNEVTLRKVLVCNLGPKNLTVHSQALAALQKEPRLIKTISFDNETTPSPSK